MFQYPISYRKFHKVSGQIKISVKQNHYDRALRKEIIIVRKTIHCLIATYCIEMQLPLLYGNRDSDPVIEHLKLQSVRSS